MPNKDWTWPSGQGSKTWRWMWRCGKNMDTNSASENELSEEIPCCEKNEEKVFWQRDWLWCWTWRWAWRWAWNNWVWRRCCGK